MAGQLLMATHRLAQDLYNDKFRRQVYSALSGKLPMFLQKLIANYGIPRSHQELLVMPLRCDRCDIVQALGDVIGANVDPHCVQCGEPLYDRAFVHGVAALAQIDWKAAFGELLRFQKYCLICPVPPEAYGQ